MGIELNISQLTLDKFKLIISVNIPNDGGLHFDTIK